MEHRLDTSDAYAALRIEDFRRFVVARFLLTFGIQMQSVIVGWQIYALTHDALALGLIGLAEAIPFLGIALFAGHVADRLDRKRIILAANAIYLVCGLALLAIAAGFHGWLAAVGPAPIYVVIFITGLARGFLGPATGAFAAQLIPNELFGNASTWNSLIWQIAAMTGPAVGGLMYGFGGVGAAYLLVVCFSTAGLLFFAFVKRKPLPSRGRDESLWGSLAMGLRFVFHNQIILSAMTLDMFAVFFGGAVSVLPLFADRVLHTGPQGLGLLRAAPAIGAIVMSLVLAHRPPFGRAGRNLLACVMGFGLCMICFAVSRSFFLSMFLLMLSGSFDNVSVVIRGTIVQLYTPNEMRGRVSAVNGIFIGSSNELGSFESGVAARLMGLIPSVIFGGCTTLGVVAAVGTLAPKLRRLRL